MKIIELDQRTSAWEDWRSDKVGASDAPVIMGVSPWKTPHELWMEKLGLWRQEVTSAMKRGTEREEEALREFEAAKDDIYYPACIEHPEHPHIIASLDGVNLNKTKIVEIKWPGVKTHEIAKKGEIPDHYWPQLQHILMVSGLDEVDYLSCYEDDRVVVTAKRDETYIANLIEKEMEFLEFVRRMEAPPFTDKDIIERYDYEWQELAHVYKELCRQQKAIEEKLLETRSKLEEISEGRSCRGGGIFLQHSIRKGSVDYRAIPELKDVDLEKYRKTPSKILTIRETKS